ncbi:hypothetical protein PISMIDRAFT_115423 [Pisolithus microcarpus 441]|uniref:Unplaced genomic scaffold scaffold_214, whole genome shotgun sequence n=1 Tax=Pisolithus microcarpus 441 TaxID=765257 RepID=A0A0C9YMW1_9AGAM|nr:hypothetical protein PISMIDRAFT_115423 [Pisolithus microcarpus 441]
MVIPAMDYIDEIFTMTMLDDMRLDPSIRAAVGLAKRTLNKYYSLTDMSDLYHIAMVLHPHHKLEYFRQVKWEADWIKMAGELVHCNYDSLYVSCDIHEDVGSPSSDGEERKDRLNNIFDRLPSLSKINSSHMLDELDAYLATGVEDIDVGDAIQWWDDH